MTFNIFQVDWILVDSVIIIILIMILCSVKIYKVRHRWRNSIINASISKINLDPNFFQLIDNKIYVKKWNLMQNPRIQEIKPHLPTIFIFSSRTLHYLPNAVLEGLCSYGFTVNYIVFKRRWNFFKKQDATFAHKTQRIVSQAFNYLIRNDHKINYQYWLIDFNSYFSQKEVKSDIFDQIGLILINPSLKKSSSNLISNQIHLNLIFSKKSYLWFRNRKIAKFMKVFSRSTSKHVKIDVLEQTNLYFKNNETILLAKIMTKIQNTIN